MTKFGPAVRSLFATLALASVGGLGTTAHAATIAHWSLQDGAVGTAATGSISDISGNGHNGTAFGSPVYTTLPSGDIGLDFGVGFDHIRINDPAPNGVFASPSLTVEALVQVHYVGAGLSQIVFRGNGEGGNDPFFLGVLNGFLRWQIEGPTGLVAAALSYSLVNLVNEEIYVAGTIDDATGDMKLFVNGSEVASQTTTVRPTYPISTFPGCGISIGALHDCNATGQHFDGVIGEVRISDMALTSSQLLGATAAVPVPAALPLLAGGLGLLGLIGRRRKRDAAAH